jgi:hypothetical protein
MSGGAEALRSLPREPHATHIRSFMAIVALLRIGVLSPLTLLEAHLAFKDHADLACDGPMAAAPQALAERVKTGERIVCMCWWPKPCHGRLIIDEIKRRLE